MLLINSSRYQDKSDYILSQCETERLISIANESGPDSESAIEKLIVANIGLIYKVQKRYNTFLSPTFDIDDLLSTALMGFCRAIQLFEPEKGFKFQTYAGSSMHYQIWRAIETQSISLRLPVVHQRQLYKLQKVRNKFQQINSREPIIEELCEFSGLSIEYVSFLSNLPYVSNSIDEPMDCNNDSLGETITDQKDFVPIIEESIDREILLQKLSSILTSKELIVVLLHYGFITGYDEGLSLSDIANILDLSRERVRQLHISAKSKLEKSKSIFIR